LALLLALRRIQMMGNTKTVPIPVSERMRLYRERRREGVRLVRVPLQVDDLVQLGLLKQDERQNEKALRAAVLSLLHHVLNEAKVPFWARD
jgi:hypothetical protein